MFFIYITYIHSVYCFMPSTITIFLIEKVASKFKDILGLKNIIEKTE